MIELGTGHEGAPEGALATSACCRTKLLALYYNLGYRRVLALIGWEAYLGLAYSWLVDLEGFIENGYTFFF